MLSLQNIAHTMPHDFIEVKAEKVEALDYIFKELGSRLKSVIDGAYIFDTLEDFKLLGNKAAGSYPFMLLWQSHHMSLVIYDHCELSALERCDKTVLPGWYIDDNKHQWKKCIVKFFDPYWEVQSDVYREYMSDVKREYQIQKYLVGIVPNMVCRILTPLIFHHNALIYVEKYGGVSVGPGKLPTLCAKLEFLEQMFGLIAELHQKARIIHRDIKWSNIVQSRRGRLRLIDWEWATGAVCPRIVKISGNCINYAVFSPLSRVWAEDQLEAERAAGKLEIDAGQVKVERVDEELVNLEETDVWSGVVLLGWKNGAFNSTVCKETMFAIPTASEKERMLLKQLIPFFVRVLQNSENGTNMKRYFSASLIHRTLQASIQYLHLEDAPLLDVPTEPNMEIVEKSPFNISFEEVPCLNVLLVNIFFPRAAVSPLPIKTPPTMSSSLIERHSLIDETSSFSSSSDKNHCCCALL